MLVESFKIYLNLLLSMIHKFLPIRITAINLSNIFCSIRLRVIGFD
jgi:hypothetical protein